MTTTTPRLLIVDDERHIRSALGRALSLMGYETAEAGSGTEALILAGSGKFDLMLLDLQMPGMTGTEVIQQIPHIAPGLPIIILTGHATLESAISAVKSAEVMDYLMKPASVHQVAAAVRQGLQKQGKREDRPADQTVSPDPERFLQYPPITLDRQRRMMTLENSPTPAQELTKSEAIVLTCLLERPNQVLSCAELGKAVWGYEVSEDYAQGPIRSIIFRLRSKIETAPQAHGLIRTVRSGGYTFSPRK